MASLVTLGSMVASVRLRANLENQTAFIPNSEIEEYLNDGIQEVYDFLVKARCQEYYRKTANFTTVSNTSFYSYSTMGATDFYELISLDVTVGTNQVLTARPYMEFERNRYKFYPGWFYNQPIYYRLLGGATSDVGGLNFIPAPSGAFACALNYYPVFTPFATDGSDDGDSFDGVNGWERYAIWKAVADCKAKGDEDPTYALGMCAKIEERISQLAAQRDAGSPERVHDVSVNTDQWGGG